MANSPQQSTDSVAFLGATVLALAAWAFWHFGHTQILQLLRYVRHGELWLLARIVSDQHVAMWSAYLDSSNKSAVIDVDHISSASTLVGDYLRWPVAIILALLAARIVFASPKQSFKKTYSLDRLIATQSKMWPVVTPIVTFNPAADNARDPADPVPDVLPLFAEALSPEEWLSFYKISNGVDGLDRESCAAVFADQLGMRWRGPNALPWHSKAIFAAFALKAARQREEADTLLGLIATQVDPRRRMAFRPNSLMKTRIGNIIDDPKIGGEASKVAAKHAFVSTAMLRLLQHARERGGVLAPAQFLWLRGADRSLWYPLNNLGRQAFHCEAAGAMSHFFAERSADSPLLSPKMDAAVESLHYYDHRKSRLLPGIAE